jgi:hypothetical protein
MSNVTKLITFRLESLDNIAVVAPTAGQALVYSTANGGSWVNGSGGGGSGGVGSFNTRTGSVVLTYGDVIDALGFTPVNNAGDTMSGMLTLSSNTPSNNYHAATKKYVDDAVAGVSGGGGSSGVSAFNLRAGNVTLNSTDVISALSFTPYNSTNPLGFLTPATAVTSIDGKVGTFQLGSYLTTSGNTIDVRNVVTSIGNTYGAIQLGSNMTMSGNVLNTTGGSGGVIDFNGRTGLITLTSADVTSALTYSPYNGTTNPLGFLTVASAVTSINNVKGAITLGTQLTMSGSVINVSSDSGWGNVGSFAFAKCVPDLYPFDYTILNPGDSVAGSRLRPAGVSVYINGEVTIGRYVTSGFPMAGTWRCLGLAKGTSSTGDSGPQGGITLFQRIA